MDIKLKKIIKTTSLGISIGGVEIEVPNFRTDLKDIEGVVKLIVDLLNLAVGFSVIVAIIMVIYGGYTFITANGDPENISKGGKILTAAIVGLVIVFLARFIIVFILEEFLL